MGGEREKHIQRLFVTSPIFQERVESPYLVASALYAYIDEKLGPEEIVDESTILGAFFEMDQIYRENELRRAEQPAWIEPSINEELFQADLEFIENMQDLDELPSYSNRESISSATQKTIKDFGEAYLRLMKRKDPDGWLIEFIQENPEFASHIGGVPSWLAEVHEKIDWWGIVGDYYKCVAVSNERYGEITPFLLEVFEWIQWLYEEEGILYAVDEIKQRAAQIIDISVEEFEKVLIQLARNDPGTMV